MTKLKIAQGDWIVVCDGAKALIFENAGDSKFPNLKTKEVYQQENAKTHELGTDAPGRSLNSARDGQRSAMEQTDWHDLEEQRFLEALTVRLGQAVEQGDVKSLVLVAPPRALGMLRQAYSGSHGLQKAITTEIDKDYVKMPVHEIEKHLLG